ncbi:MAG: thioredoxin TrxC [Gammaproteobacteria bacterium]|nr:thioredoxin TrxC [Gammaproteobacteria bacterium]
MNNFLHIACPICATTNRVPTNKLNGKGACGKCGAPLFNYRPVELNSNNFDRMIKNNDIPVLVDFWAPWCGPCKMMAPTFEQAAQQLEPHIRLGKLNTENEQAIAARYNIRSIPTLALFKNGRVIAQQAGAMNLDQLIAWSRSQATKA